MANTSQDLADALEHAYRTIEERNAHILRSADLSRSERELLVKSGWLQEIIKGWYMLVKPGVSSGDSAAWYANFWDFLCVYLEHHFGKSYCLSAESSLDLHVDSPAIPKQVVVIVKEKGNLRPLPFDTSVLTYASSKGLPEEREEIRGLQVIPLPYALCKVTPTFFVKAPQEAEIALRLVRSPSDLSRTIVAHHFKAAAGRLIGAYRFLGDEVGASAIKRDLEAVGWSVQEENPFESAVPLIAQTRLRSPYMGRIVALWESFRQPIVDMFPDPPGLPRDKTAYLENIEHVYARDAYNSLSIEGYQVNVELIERVRNQEWSPGTHPEDREAYNALAARGYFEAYLSVRQTIKKVLDGEEVGNVVENDLQGWYQSLFAPNVEAGLVRLEDLLGYRTSQVYIRNSRHTPPPKEALLDSMEALFECLKEEDHPAVRAVLGHYFFVFVHPYMDGNGRIGRFLMNVMFASGGYPWTVIRLEKRKQYFSALEIAGVEKDIQPFAAFVLQEMQEHSAR